MVHAEIVLKCDGRIGLRRSLNFHIFLRFNSLVKTVRITASFHDTAGLFIDNFHFVVHDDVLRIFFEQGVRFEQLVDGMNALGFNSVIAHDHILLRRLFLRTQSSIFQRTKFRRNIGHDEKVFCGILRDQIDPFTTQINLIVFLLNNEIHFLINEFHFLALLLHVIRLRLLEQ